MDVSQIQRVLGMFTKSHVSIPIRSNKYEELYEHGSDCDSSTLSCKYDMLDDMLVECRKQPTKSNVHVNKHDMSFECVKQITRPKQQIENKIIKDSSHYLDKFFFALCCIKDPLMSLKEMDKSAITKMKHDLMAFIDNTQVKALDMAKYKYTKKGIREVLTKCLTVDLMRDTQNEFEWMTLRTVLVVAVRHLKKPITMQIQGEVKEHFPLPASITQEPSSTKEEGTIINYVDNCFIVE
jgi:hypothetical protein